MNTIDVKTPERCTFVDITAQVREAVLDLGMENATIQIFVPHTTAGITINEKADPNVAVDILNRLEFLVPYGAGYSHAEGNSDAHIKTLLTGSSVLLPVEKGNLVLGTWQAVFFAEFDGPRNRKVVVNPVCK